MKNIYSSLLFITLSFTAFSQEIEADFQINEVVFFPSKALFKCEKELPVSKGQNHLVINNIPALIDESSIDFWSEDKFTLLNIEFKHTPNTTKLLNSYKDSLSKLENNLELTQNMLKIYENQQKEILKHNNIIISSNNSLDAEQSIKWINYSQLKTTELLFTLDSLKNKFNKLTDEKRKLEKIIENQLNNSVRGQLDIYINVKEKALNTFKLNFMVNNAGWESTVEINYNETDYSIELIKKAKLYQNTGLELSNVKTFISNISPQTRFDRPLMFPKYYSYQKRTSEAYSYGLQMTAGSYQKHTVDKEEVNSNSKFRNYIDEVNEEIKHSNLDSNKVIYEAIGKRSSDQLLFLGTIDIKNNQKYSYILLSESLSPPVYKIILPQKDNSAYIIAKLKKDTYFTQDTASIKVFENHKYIGESGYISDIASDSILVPLGVDNAILTEYLTANSIAREQFFGKYKFVTKTNMIAIKNNSSVETDLKVIDQIPLGRDGIDIEVVDISKGKYNRSNGKVEWILNLKPFESKILQVTYAIKYLKSARLYLNE